MSRKIKLTLEMVGGGIAFFVLFIVVVMPYLGRAEYSSGEVDNEASVLGTATTTPAASSFLVTHVDTPQQVKGIYMTACVASVPSWRTKLADMISSTELNTVVIDVKDYTGTVSFIAPELRPEPGPGCRVRDMKEYIDELHKRNIYVIGRVAVFQDPLATAKHPEWAVRSKSAGGVWKDRKGLSFIDVGAKPYWDEIVAIAKRSYDEGFDEINFDYIRYPSDGNMKDADYTWMTASSTKALMVKSFFEYLHEHLKDTGMKTSADLFGLVTVAEDDLGIGQVLTNALPYFDYVMPMVYPSHFAPGSNNISKPAEHPYEIIHYSMKEGVRREEAQRVAMGISTSTPSKLRPWIQDFDLGADYGVPEVRAQIKATYDVGLNSWISWDASNKYTTGAYLAE
jgi:hypothetical protein